MENKNRSAFPLPSDTPQDYSGSDIDGLNKREYFAGLAMQGMMSESTGYFWRFCLFLGLVFLSVNI